MQIGIFSKTFDRPTLGGVLDAVVGYGLRSVQFNMSCAGLPIMPEAVAPEDVIRIRSELGKRSIEMSALSGTFNMIHPDLQQRQAGMRSLHTLCRVCQGLGTSIITLSTGTCNAENMWRSHPQNQSEATWQEMIRSMQEAVGYAEESGVTLAFEPEVSNVVDSAQRARRLLDEIQSPHLKVVIDGANLFHAGELPKMKEILHEAFDLLGNDIVLAHAKDISQDGEAGHDAAGTGLLDYDLYLQFLRQSGFQGAIILHSLSEAQTSGCVEFLRSKMGK